MQRPNKTYVLVVLEISLIAFSCCTSLLAHEPFLFCPATDFTLRKSRYCETIQPRRIVIVTPANRLDRVKEHTLLLEFLTSELSQTSSFDVVAASEQPCRDMLPMQRGVFDENELIRFSHRFGADAILYCQVDRMSGFDPMNVRLSFVLVGVNESVALASGSVVVDIRNGQTQRYYRLFAKELCTNCPLDTHRHSPRTFLHYSARATAEQIKALWPISVQGSAFSISHGVGSSAHR